MYVEWIFYDTLKILPFLRDISNSGSKKLEIRMCRNCILLNKNCRKNGCFKFYCTAKNHSPLHTLIKVLVTFFSLLYIFYLMSWIPYLSLRWRYTPFIVGIFINIFYLYLDLFLYSTLRHFIFTLFCFSLFYCSLIYRKASKNLKNNLK